MKQTPKILMVEDSPSLAAVYQAYLEGSDYEVETVETLGRAHASLGSFQPDIVLLDIELPDGNGMDFLAGMGGLETPPRVIVMTAHGSSDMAVEAMRRGGYNLGGEQSGHIVMSDHATTGDGLLAGLQFLAAMRATGRRASDLAQVFETVPQMLKNVRYAGGADPLEAAAQRAFATTIDAVDEWTQSAPPADDITLVVVRRLDGQRRT